jgi:hypothetical protein
VDTTVSPRIKLFALVGGLAAAALAGGMFFLSRTPPVDDSPIPPPAPRVQRQTQALTAKPKPAVAARNPVAVAIAKELVRHRVVVVSVFAHDAGVDTIALYEALAGARDAHAGFVAVDVSDKAAALALAEEAKQLSAPAVLVFERGAGMVRRFHGIADRTLVAQLASSPR